MFESIRIGGRAAARILVVAHFKDQNLDSTTRRLDPDGSLEEAAARAEATGEVGSISEAFPWEGEHERLILVGLGEKGSCTPAIVRSAAAAVARRVARYEGGGIDVELAGAFRGARLDVAEGGRAVGEAFGLLAYSSDEFRGAAAEDKDRPKVSLRSSDAELTKGLRLGVGLADGANLARRLSDTPPNIATPDFMASEARKLARETGMSCTVMKGDRLERENFQGLINVGKASEHKPCMIRLEYRPSRTPRDAEPVVLVGKTLTYDSGGLSLKVNNAMRGMKRDKDGGCALLGAMQLIAKHIKPNRPVIALLPAAENAISDEAYRPDDIITFRNGVTVEVHNTDAEGRLVMADALCWACEKEKPGLIVDIATLTGGVVVALGKVFAGLWCDDDDLCGALEEAGEATGERLWRMPHDPAYNEMMRSVVADVHNGAPVRDAHATQAAAFLSYFVEDDIPWAHLDIAGTHVTDKDNGVFTPGPTGFGARLIARLLEDEAV